MGNETYTAKELFNFSRNATSRNPSKCYVIDCDMWEYRVVEVFVSGFGGCSSDSEMMFTLSDGNNFDCEKYAGDVFKTRESAMSAASKQQQKLEQEHGGKESLDKMRARFYEFHYKAQRGDYDTLQWS